MVRAIGLLALLTASCAADETAPTEIYLNVAATLKNVDHVILTARTPAGIEDVITRPTTDRDINVDPLAVRLTPADGFGLEFLLMGEGYAGDQRIVANAIELAFAQNDRRDFELVMDEGFANDDFDRDGYRLCGTGSANPDDPCDCDDRNTNISPLSPEICGNNVDDDCTGTADDGC